MSPDFYGTILGWYEQLWLWADQTARFAMPFFFIIAAYFFTRDRDASHRKAVRNRLYIIGIYII